MAKIVAIGRSVCAALLCVLLLLNLALPTQAHQPALDGFDQQYADLIEDHGHAHEPVEDILWAIHGHSHDGTADHDHNHVSLLSTTYDIYTTISSASWRLEPSPDHPALIFSLKRPPRV